MRSFAVPAGLLALSAVPSVSSVLRLLGLLGAMPTAPEAARLAAYPVALSVHAVGFTVYALLGALQFSPALLHRRWHRMAGRIAVVFGMAGALGAIALAHAAPLSTRDAAWLPTVRIAAGIAMLGCLSVGFATARNDVAAHRAWMTRAYALGLGAGTQVFTVVPYMLLAERHSRDVHSLLLASAWLVNLAVAELALRRSGTTRRQGGSFPQRAKLTERDARADAGGFRA